MFHGIRPTWSAPLQNKAGHCLLPFNRGGSTMHSARRNWGESQSSPRIHHTRRGGLSLASICAPEAASVLSVTCIVQPVLLFRGGASLHLEESILGDRGGEWGWHLSTWDIFAECIYTNDTYNTYIHIPKTSSPHPRCVVSSLYMCGECRSRCDVSNSERAIHTRVSHADFFHKRRCVSVYAQW